MLDIHILGAGAMGCLWASYFHEQVLAHSVQLHLIVRDSSDWINQHDHITCLPKQNRTPVHIVNAKNAQKIHHLIVATKAQHTAAALREIEPHLSADCEILLLQNGMGSQHATALTFPQMAVYACSSTEGAYKTEFNQVVHAGQGDNFIGALTATAKESKLATWLPKHKFHWQNDIETLLWRKLIINAAINGLTVRHQCRNGLLLEKPEAISDMRSLCVELDGLIQIKQLALPDAWTLAEQVCQRTAQNYSSMYQDVKKGRATEIDFINGYIIEQATKYGLPCHHHQNLFDQIKALTEHNSD